MDQDVLSELNPEQLQSLQEFRDIVQTDDIQRAVRTLSRNQWDVQAAVDSFFGNPTHDTDARSPSVEHNRTMRAARDSGSSNYFQWLFQSVPTALDPDEDSKTFVREFDSKFGSTHAAFFGGSYTKAVRSAYENSKFLLVYLHSPLHEDTENFCRQTLCAITAIQYMNQHVVFWGGSTDHAEAYNLSHVLKATRFPFLALLVCQSERSVQLIDRVQGLLNEHDVLSRVQSAVNAHGSALQRIAADRSVRHETSTLRFEQDREYLEAQEEDRRQLAKKNEEKREREEKEERLRQEAELENAIRMSAELDRQNRIEKLRKKLHAEPLNGSADVANIKFQLPSGKKLTRNFAKTDKVEDLRIFLQIHFYDNEIPISDFSISTNYPKRALENSEEDLERAGLYPRGILFVQDLNA